MKHTVLQQVGFAADWALAYFEILYCAYCIGVSKCTKPQTETYETSIAMVAWEAKLE